MTPLDIALDYISRGWSPIPIPYREKGPKITGWQALRINAETAAHHFNGAPQNVGVLMGPLSQGLVDVDLDSAEAVAVASFLLPKTGAIFGRASRSGSHYLYVSDIAERRAAAVVEYCDPLLPPGDKPLVELRIGGGGKGAQTVFPGSTHPTGEPIKWDEHGEPAFVEGRELEARVARVAAAALLSRHWSSGRRHKIALALAGMLAHGAWAEGDARLLVEAIARAAGDEEWPARVNVVRDTFAKQASGEKVVGLPTLLELVDEKVARKAAEWLAIRDAFGFARRASAAGAAEHTAPDAVAATFSDEALALRFAEQHASGLRYVAPWNRWLHWDGTRWRADDSLLAFDYSRKICRQASAECNKASTASTIASAKTVAAVERLAKADRRLAGTVDQWDADPLLFNEGAQT
jgi:hypothetical protein